MRLHSCWTCLAAGIVAVHAHAADSWQQVVQKTHPAMPGDEIQMIKNGTENGVVWIGTLTGAVKLEAGALTPLDQTKGLKVWDVTKRPEGGIWIGHGSGVMLLDGDRKADALKGNTVASIQRVGTQMWALAKNESTDRNILVKSDGESWQPVPEFKDRRVLDMLQDAKGIFWLILDGDGVLELDPKKSASAFRHHLPRMNVTSILTDTKGRNWCGLWGGGVMMKQDQEWTRLLDKERTAVLSLIEDSEGRIWAATSGNGVWVFDGANWKGMLQDEGSINLLKATSDKRIWISSQRRGGLRYWDGTEWKLSLDNGMPMRCMLELPDKVLLAGGVLDGLHILGNLKLKGE